MEDAEGVAMVEVGLEEVDSEAVAVAMAVSQNPPSLCKIS